MRMERRRLLRLQGGDDPVVDLDDVEARAAVLRRLLQQLGLQRPLAGRQGAAGKTPQDRCGAQHKAVERHRQIPTTGGAESQGSEMAVAGPGDGDLAPGRVAQPDPLPGVDRADLAQPQPELAGERGERRRRLRRGREQQFVIVAGRGGAAAVTVAATPDASQIWPRSASSPSEMSAIAWARPARRGPSATRGSGSWNRAASIARSGAESSPWPPRSTSSPSAASPIVPETQMRSPGRAPLRRIAAPAATSPSAVSDNTAGPGVATESPPSRLTP